jgi:tetratricopeptide (TPR) repeat protein
LILGTALLGSLYFVHRLSEKKTSLRWALSIALYLVALGAKEIAILYPLIVVALLWRGERDSGEEGVSWARTLSIAWPFVVVAVAYFIVRQSILGFVQLSGSEASLSETVLTAPAVIGFYLRQMILPYWIGPSYPLRAVTTANIGMANCIIPLVFAIVAGWWMIRMAKLSKTARIGLALLLIPLLPTLNIAAFRTEQLVHDRYLYVPLLGFLILTVPAIASLLQRIVGERAIRQPLLIFVFAVIVSVPLAAQTVRYNRAWTSNLALWAWGTQSDPNSAYSYQLYGTALYEAKRLEEAIVAFNRSIEILPIASAYVVRAAAFIDQRKFAEAERDLRAVTSRKQVSAYTLYRAYRDLAVCLASQGRANEAAEALKQGRIHLPYYTAALTGKLSSILYTAGRKDEALSELNGARAQARTEGLPESRLLLYGLGILNVELGHPEDARNAFLEFLSVTEGMLSPGVKQARAEAEVALRKLSRQDPP